MHLQRSSLKRYDTAISLLFEEAEHSLQFDADVCMFIVLQHCDPTVTNEGQVETLKSNVNL